MSEIRNYAAVTGAYWAFTVTDGALRMLVLLFLHDEGFEALEIASLFLFYEFFGVVTNLLGGWLGARFGLKLTLFLGLILQVAALGVLAWQSTGLTMWIVMAVQAASGVAKDLTKMSAKSYLKFVVADEGSRLLRWVALLTGSKNALKGVGFFVGGYLLATVGFAAACAGMAAGLLVVLLVATVLLPRASGRSKKSKFTSLLSRSQDVNRLSAARLFLFGARDVWFVLGVPLFLSTQLSWDHPQVGAFLALWVIGYGIVQAMAPTFLNARQRLWPWTATLLVPLLAIVLALELAWSPAWTIILGLTVFGLLFAANSALHSFLIIAYSEDDDVAMDVGFYYMANAAGRLLGTVASGALYQYSGLTACLIGSLASVAISALLAVRCRPASRVRYASADS